jgi:hypothetical protein
VTYSIDDYVRASRFIQQRTFLFRYRFLLPLVVAAVISIWIYFLDPYQFVEAFSEPKNLVVIFVAPLVAVAVLFILSRRKTSFLLRRQVSNQIESSPAMRQPQTIRFDEEGIEGQTLLSSGTVKWEAVIEATESQDDLFFFTSKKFAMFVPKDAFEGPQDIDAVRQLATAKLGEKAQGFRTVDQTKKRPS